MYSKVIVTPVTEPFGAGGACCGGGPGVPGSWQAARAPGIIRAVYTPAVYPIRVPHPGAGPVLAFPGEVG